MAINDKLTHLLKQQNISNSKLAKALSVDPSLVSRWKSGERPLAVCSPFLSAIATFVTHQCKSQEHRLQLLTVLNITDTAIADTPEHTVAAVIDWLAEDISATHQWVNQFLGHMSKPKTTPTDLMDFKPYVSSAMPRAVNVEVYSGLEGKRAAVIQLLSKVIHHPKPVKLLLFSDESIDWLISDAQFTKTWGLYILKALEAGHRIQIVHTIKRDIGEMLTAISNWMPLYMTGAIDPYYDPKYKEIPLKRTHFLAPGIALVASYSVKGFEDQADQFLFTDVDTLVSTEKMFDAYLLHCKPLMHIFTLSKLDAFQRLQQEFEEDANLSIIYAVGLSIWTLPSQALERILKRLAFNEKIILELLCAHKKRVALIKEKLVHQTRTEIVHIPKTEDFLTHITPKDLFIPLGSAYTFDDYTEHLANTLALEKQFENYTVVMSETCVLNDIHLTVKKNVGVFLIRSGNESIAFAFNQPSLTDSFYSYMQNVMQCSDQKTP